MDNETAVKILIENELYNYIIDIRKLYNPIEADKAIQEFKEKFKETVLKKYPVEDIDGLIESTLSRVEKNREKEIAD